MAIVLCGTTCQHYYYARLCPGLICAAELSSHSSCFQVRLTLQFLLYVSHSGCCLQSKVVFSQISITEKLTGTPATGLYGILICCHDNHSVFCAFIQFKENVGHIFVNSAPLVKLPEVIKQWMTHPFLLYSFSPSSSCFLLLPTNRYLYFAFFQGRTGEFGNCRCSAAVQLFLHAGTSLPHWSEFLYNVCIDT